MAALGFTAKILRVEFNDWGHFVKWGFVVKLAFLTGGLVGRSWFGIFTHFNLIYQLI